MFYVFLLASRDIEAKSNPIDLQAIKQLYQAKKYNQVITHSKAYLKQYPNDVDVKLYLGLAYYQTKNNKKACSLPKFRVIWLSRLY